jgi:hypothetical protein
MPGFRIVDAARLRRAVFWWSGPVAALVLAAGCIAAANSAPPSASPGVLASPVASPSPAISAMSTPVAAPNANSSGAAATPALPPATIDVSPPRVQIGDVALSMALEPARHMLAQAAATTVDSDPAHQPASATPSMAASTSLVLDDLLRLTNNIDPSQPVPEDQPQAMIRHLDVQIRTADGGFPVPYVAASVDLLLDGHPVLSNLALAPMVAGESATRQLYYGNNLKLMQRGTYQVFVRLQPSVLLGKDPPPAAQFNVAVH